MLGSGRVDDSGAAPSNAGRPSKSLGELRLGPWRIAKAGSTGGGGSGRAGGHPPADTGVDEAVDIAVEHRVGRGDLVLGPQVLHHLVRMEHVGAHLRTPAVPPVALQGV